MLPRDAVSFVRAVDIFLSGPFSEARHPQLREVLATADEEFEKVAKFCGATVVHHEWKLLPTEKDVRSRCNDLGAILENPYEELGIPSQHALVAEVDLIKKVRHIRPGSTEDRRIQAGLGNYYKAANADQSLYYQGVLSDMFTGQFITGMSAREEQQTGTAPRRLWMQDIEPRLY